MRLIEIRSEKLNEECVALSLKVQEKLNEEPSYELELVSPDADLDLDGLLADVVALDIDLDEGKKRTFHTHVIGAWDTGQKDDKYTYTLELGSWLSFLRERRNCRIFQHQTVPQIVEQIFQSQGKTDFRFELERSYAQWEYCVQYRESDLTFVKRLLEVEGIYFWVEHEENRHVVVMADHQRFQDLEEPYASLRFLPDGEEHRAIQGREGVQRIQRTRRIRPNNVALRDFDYHVPSKRLDADAQVEQHSLAGLTLEHYEYADAGLYRDVERGERLAQIRLEAMQAQASTLTGTSNVRGLTIGKAFSIEGHPDEKRNRRFHLISTKLHFVQDGPDSTSQGRNVGGEFKVLHDDQPFRPRLLTPRPVVPGIQSATVVGPAGSEVHTDKLGRIRVHFHWDRYKSTEEDASCWIRVSQAWAGKGWGVIAMPRVGQEVLITYVDGNIDCPLVTGIVYNGENPTPYDLPKDIRYTGIVSRSHKFGKFQHASQLTFDDTRGSERVMIHAERDKQVTVERNLSTIVKQDENKKVEATSTTVKDLSISYTRTSISYTGQSVSYTGLSVSYTGISKSFTGISTSFTGVSTSFTGKSTSFTGVSTSFTGISTGFTGVSTSFTGVSTSFTGMNTGITGVSVSMTGVSSSMTGVSTSATGKSSSVTGVNFSATGVSTSVTGSSVSATGSSVSKTGSSVSTTGSSVSATGSSVSTTGTSISTTGLSISMTGTSISHTGTSITIKGLKTEKKEISQKQFQSLVSSYGMQVKM